MNKCFTVETYTLIQVKRDMVRNRKLLGDKIWNLTKVSQVLMEENWTRDVTAEMKKFEKEIVHAMKVRFSSKFRNTTNQCGYLGNLQIYL